MTKKIHNPSVGEILKFEFLDELNMSQNGLAKAIGVPANRIHAIIRGERSITADTDLRLCKFFGLSEGYFLRLQLTYDLLEAKRKLMNKIAKIKPYATIIQENSTSLERKR
ncbi:MAG TPA: HigA family addiction module antitoxin [Candidatus Babeliales bacterium]|jgi:addiction module HigA family antidote|nr:HigA family addiction module antitoxin [Candidatus Babeliales bacterium]